MVAANPKMFELYKVYKFEICKTIYCFQLHFTQLFQCWLVYVKVHLNVLNYTLFINFATKLLFF